MRRSAAVAAAAYQLAVIGPLLAWVASEVGRDPGRFLHLDILIWVLLIGVVDLMPVPAVGGLQLTLSFPFGLAVAILYAPPVAAVIALIGAFDRREFQRRLTVSKAIFIRAEIAITILVESRMFHSLGSIQSPLWVLMYAVAVAASVGYVVNALLVATYLRLVSGRSVLSVVRTMHVGGALEYVGSYLTLSALAALIALIFTDQGWPAVLIFVAPLAVARQMFFRARDLQQVTDDLRDREAKLQTLSDQLASQNAVLAEQARQLEAHLGRERQAVAELRELNHLKDDFVAAVSHELRNPLTAILGFARTLRQPGFAEDTVTRGEFLDAIERQSLRLHRLVENLLHSAKLDPDPPQEWRQRVIMTDLIAEVVEGLGAEAARVVIHLPPDTPVVLSDRNLLEAMVSNLVDNALKFSSREDTVDVEASVADGVLSIAVRDRGLGIPPDALPRIFDRFYQVDQSSTRPAGGLGIGLSLVKTLSEGLGGSVEVSSEVGRGSTFTVRLPAPAAAVESAQLA
jgi:signal transduction histidine kinase